MAVSVQLYTRNVADDLSQAAPYCCAALTSLVGIILFNVVNLALSVNNYLLTK